MDDARRVRAGRPQSKGRDRVSLLTGLLGLASAIALGTLLYVGRDYTGRTEPGWWWNALVACGLLTGVFWIASVAFSSGRRSAPVSPPTAGPETDPQVQPSHEGPRLAAWGERPASVVYEPDLGTRVPPRWDDPEEPTRWDLAATPTGPPEEDGPPEYGAEEPVEEGADARLEDGPDEPVEYTAVYRRSTRGWVVEVEEVADCYVEASTLYEAREGVVRSLRDAGHAVDGSEVVDDVELPPEAAEAINGAGSGDRALSRAAVLLVEGLELAEADAAALLGVSRSAVEKALVGADPTEVAAALEDEPDWSEDDLDDEIAVEHIRPYDAPASR